MSKNILKSKYEAQIFESRFQFHRTVPFSHGINYTDTFYDNIPVVTERGIEINMDPVQYELLLKDLEFLDDIPTNGVKDHRYAEQVLRKEHYERELRSKYPSLQDAYEKYQTLLALVSDGKH